MGAQKQFEIAVNWKSGREPRAALFGGSAGGTDALIRILRILPSGFPLPILVVQHLHRTDDGRFADHLGRSISLPAKEAEDKEQVREAHVYVAPANYHLLVERGGALALSVDPRVNWARPSIDVLFDTAARAWGGDLVAVVLSGANDDGAKGLGLIREHGGLCIVQDPSSAQSAVMPQAAIDAVDPQLILPPEDIGELLRRTFAPSVANPEATGTGGTV